ncbi:MAG TPA: FAD-binding oxidoreductase [Patescibacteria group bacterium]|jgi:ferredoxin-NADP reductase
MIQAPQQYKARLADKTIYNSKFERYTFELREPNQLEFAAGQYASFLVSEQGHRRSWSICSSPEVDHGFEILIDPAPMGIGTQFLHKLKLGDEANLLAPMGRFIVEPTDPKQALAFVATGVGITPFRSMLLDLLQTKKDPRPMTLYWGLRHVEEMIWQDEFQELSENFPNFQFHPVISRATQEWPLCRGRVTDCLNTHQLPANAGYYLCGSDQMIVDVTNLLLAKNVPPERIYREKFY